MKSFTALINLLEQTDKSNERVLMLHDFFAGNDEDDKLWTLSFLCGYKLKCKVKTSLLKVWALELSEFDEWLFDESFLISGDVIETISLMLPNPIKQEELKFRECIELIQSLEELKSEEQKSVIISVWKKLNGVERFIFNKLITGTFKINVKQKIICKALADFTDLDETTLAHRISVEWNPETTSFNQLVKDVGAEDHFSKPFPFLIPVFLEEKNGILNDIENLMVEWKWEGVRAQIIRRNKQLFIWNEEGELITTRYPEFDSLSELLPDGIVVDGIIIGFLDGHPLSVQKLQSRLKSKTVNAKWLIEVPVVFMVFDLLEYQSEDCRNLSLIERRKKLEDLIGIIGNDSSLLISEELKCTSFQELDALRIKSRKLFCDGIVLKSKSSTYNEAIITWWKWKPDPIRIKTVLLYVQVTQGGKAGVYEELTFAVWDKEALVPVAKTAIGLNKEDLLFIVDFVKKNTLEKFGPVKSIKPELVFEIELESVHHSIRHKSGIVVQHPKIYLQRIDLKITDVGTLDEVKALIVG